MKLPFAALLAALIPLAAVFLPAPPATAQVLPSPEPLTQPSVPGGVPDTAAVPVPAAVMRAAVRGEQVFPGGAGDGRDLKLQRIERPVYTPEELAAEAAARLPAPTPTAAQKALMLKARQEAAAKAPAQILLFSPRITSFGGTGPDGCLSLVEWWTADAATGYAEAAAWVRGPDIAGTIQAVGDLEVPMAGTGKNRRYLMMPSVGLRPDPRQSPPPASEFQSGGAIPGSAVVLMEKGQPTPAALEAVQALLAAYADPVRSVKIAADAAARKAAQAAAAGAAAWAAAHPSVPEPAVVKFYTSDADETETLAAKAAAGTPEPGK